MVIGETSEAKSDAWSVLQSSTGRSAVFERAQTGGCPMGNARIERSVRRASCALALLVASALVREASCLEVKCADGEVEETRCVTVTTGDQPVVYTNRAYLCANDDGSGAVWREVGRQLGKCSAHLARRLYGDEGANHGCGKRDNACGRSTRRFSEPHMHADRRSDSRGSRRRWSPPGRARTLSRR